MRLLTLLFFVSVIGTSRAQEIPAIGLAQDITSDSIAYASGYTYLVSSISKYISPRTVSEEQFKTNASQIKKLKTPLYGFNLFIPAELKLVGDNVNEKEILEYTNIVLQRTQALGVRIIVWGSGGARKIPDGFDRNRAVEQFTSIAKKIAKQAADYGVVIAIENLNSTETNFINTLQEGFDIVKKVNDPNLRLCADIYHMLKENESPAVIEKAGKFIVHCDLAEKEKRTAPGKMGDDFRPYFTALKKINFKGAIILECRWDNLKAEALPALKYVEKQLDEVYMK